MKKYFHLIGTNGSTMPILNKKMFEEIKLPIVDKTNQDKIAKILSTIDSKIIENTATNDNLQEYCNNIYKSWFIDYTSIETKNHEEWKLKELGKVCECILGGTPSRNKNEYWNGNINWINSGEINKFRILNSSEKITELGLKKSSTKLLCKGTTVIAITGATLGQVSRLEIDSCANQSVIGVIGNDILPNEFIYLTMLNKIDSIALKQTGGAQQHINKNDVESFELYIPPKEIMSSFEDIVKPIFNKISINCIQNETLSDLRDTLLAKLMNGEIDLDNVEI